MDSATLERIRAVRKQENLVLKPTPYLKSTYVDEFGDEKSVQIRNYQAQGIMNLLMIQRMILGDDTGLGKTLQMLNVIGYVWLKEPEYVPIVLTKKSALYQWTSEASKFMCQMDVLTVDGEPHERHAIYDDFFLNHDPGKKRLIIMTYDSFFRDSSPSVIRDRGVKPDPSAKRGLKAAKEAMKKAEEAFTSGKSAFEIHFQGRDQSILDYAKLRLTKEPGAKEPVPHPGWRDGDEKALLSIIDVRDVFGTARQLVKDFSDLVAPPKRVPGLLDYVAEMTSIHRGTRLMLIMDEIHVLKNPKGKLHQAVAQFSTACQRAYGMTATAVKNRLMEFFALFQIICPGLFPKISRFQAEFCVTKMQKIGGGKQIPVVVGYRSLDEFVRRIEPYYISRRKHEVAKELPQLITRELVCEMTPLQEELYDMAETASDEDPDSFSSILTSMVRMQQAANAPALIPDQEGKPWQGESPKIEALIDMLKEELEGVKVIVFSVYEKMISLAEQELKKNGINCVRITGKEDSAARREKSRLTFQAAQSGVDVILITLAGAESIDLQSAEHFILLDSPWSWGDYTQLIGRMVRIGSRHKVVVTTHLVARRPCGKKVIDDYVIKTLRSKKVLADKVAGVAVKDGLKFEEGDVMALYKMIKAGQSADSPKAPKAPKAKAVRPKAPVAEVRGADLDPSDF